MKVFLTIACLLLSANAVYALPAESTVDTTDAANILEARANLPGLNALQTKYAKAIIAQAKKDGVGAYGCQIAIVTGITEVVIFYLAFVNYESANSFSKTNLMMSANKAVPSSMKFPHDRVGTNGDAVGIFQQPASIYKNVPCDMNAACSAGQLYREIKKIQGWKNMDITTICQKTHYSNCDQYTERVGLATNVCKAGGL
ncbi:hypothetical protein BDV30DRAFT_239150 [Aspergillus minisclerotigenes]|uniref:Transglycosylase SLT domain-containing protein n=1 Tax=Aspergillus minisclerotigenes TaxID=656917 RepID=A0A5N6J3M3_9EURO|nr:hypothetical protein BDV30DRAFT_239150 [Aspergillus minisclerotigenes]